MGQVPGRASWLLVGDGRLAGHLAHYFRSEGLRCERWSRRRGTPGLFRALARRADRVLLAIRDDAIPGFLAEHRQESGALWVHFSGSLAVDGAWSAHPLSTFGHELYEPPVYRAIPFIVEREGPAFGELLPGLPNPSVAIPRPAKPLYHALCVTAGNFTTLLWQRFFREIEGRWQMPPALALPYLRRTAGNLAANPAGDLLTGPIARGDAATVRANLAALEEAGLEDLAGVYAAFAAAVPDAVQEVA